MPPHSTSDHTDSTPNTFSSYLSNLNSNRTSSMFSPSHNPEEDKMEEVINNVSFQLLNLLDSEKPVPENPTFSEDSAVITCSNISYSPLLGAKAPVEELNYKGLHTVHRFRRNVIRPNKYKTIYSSFRVKNVIRSQ